MVIVTLYHEDVEKREALLKALQQVGFTMSVYKFVSNRVPASKQRTGSCTILVFPLKYN